MLLDWRVFFDLHICIYRFHVWHSVAVVIAIALPLVIDVVCGDSFLGYILVIAIVDP